MLASTHRIGNCISIDCLQIFQLLRVPGLVCVNIYKKNSPFPRIENLHFCQKYLKIGQKWSKKSPFRSHRRLKCGCKKFFFWRLEKICRQMLICAQDHLFAAFYPISTPGWPLIKKYYKTDIKSENYGDHWSNKNQNFNCLGSSAKSAIFQITDSRSLWGPLNDLKPKMPRQCPQFKFAGFFYILSALLWN
jgi:hypothetical protein